MISAVSGNISVYKPVQRTVEAAMIQADAIVTLEENKEIIRTTIAAKTVEDQRQKYLQTEYVGPAREAARLAALGGALAQQLLTQHVGPARAEARLVALGKAPNGALALQSDAQDLRSGCYAGPKPVSVIQADQQYRLALGVLS
ncbi:hypothetical protein [Parasedimentitalea huanghaiensis]|uniref:Uncharacterized protein n=1 Tax=Parasedimentitalea huanghaiensis TaxID=2682100 RepID=A0A6L6WH91_9RHOB|nr:hypothetical protein [Zongyanglinia huanghaiensis]MVO16810.1 hypothetical protein [Zongyanglinia huanghaiensis]